VSPGFWFKHYIGGDELTEVEHARGNGMFFGKGMGWGAASAMNPHLAFRQVEFGITLSIYAKIPRTELSLEHKGQVFAENINM